MAAHDFERRFAWLFCGVAVALGWGIRGEIGGPDGAVVPGAFLGLALAITSGRADWIRRAPVLGMAGALGFALGGSMSYGLLIGYTRGDDSLNVTYGYAMLGLVGGLWGAFGAGCLGLAVGPVRHRVWEIGAFVLSAWMAGQILHWLLVDLAGLRANPPRGDSWPQCIGAVLVLLAYARYKRDAFPARMTFWGFAAGSLGFMFGELCQIVPSHVGPAYDWWKVMEQTFGFVLGAGIGWAFMREARAMPETPAPKYALTVFGLIVTGWFVAWNATNEIIDYFSRGEMGILANSDAITNAALQFRFRALLAPLLIAAIGIALHKRSGRLIAADFAAKLLFSFVVWFCVYVTSFKKSVPEWEPHGLGVHTGFLIMAIVLTLWCWFGWPTTAKAPAPAPATIKEPPSLRFIAPVYIVIAWPLIALLLAAVSIAAHPGEWQHGTQVRFGEHPAAPE